MKLINFVIIQRILVFLVLIAIGLQACTQKPKEDTTQATEVETTMVDAAKEDNWIVLFDGTSTDIWRGYLLNGFPESGWVVEEGSLKCEGAKEGDEGHGGGDIITTQKFDDFELELEWKISEGGNSGIFFMAEEIEGKPIYHSAPEMQVLDDVNHPDAKNGVNGNHKSGALYDLIPADPQNAKPFGEWNTVRIVKEKGRVTFFQNDEQVVEFELWTDDWNQMIAKSKFAEMEPFAKKSEGHIGLQDHGDDVWFRNVRIRRL